MICLDMWWKRVDCGHPQALCHVLVWYTICICVYTQIFTDAGDVWISVCAYVCCELALDWLGMQALCPNCIWAMTMYMLCVLISKEVVHVCICICMYVYVSCMYMCHICIYMHVYMPSHKWWHACILEFFNMHNKYHSFCMWMWCEKDADYEHRWCICMWYVMMVHYMYVCMWYVQTRNTDAVWYFNVGVDEVVISFMQAVSLCAWLHGSLGATE